MSIAKTVVTEGWPPGVQGKSSLDAPKDVQEEAVGGGECGDDDAASVTSQQSTQSVADQTRAKKKDGVIQVMDIQLVSMEKDIMEDDLRLSISTSGSGSESSSSSKDEEEKSRRSPFQ